MIVSREIKTIDDIEPGSVLDAAYNRIAPGTSGWIGGCKAIFYVLGIDPDMPISDLSELLSIYKAPTCSCYSLNGDDPRCPVHS